MKTNLLTLLALHLGLAAVVAQPIITNQPQNQTAIGGATATFSVGATGALPLSYQWRSHASATSYTNIPFGTEATLVLTNVQPTTRRFSVVVTDAGGLSATSSPLVTLTVLVPPSVVTHPVSQTVEVGDRVSLSLVAAGTAPLAYQWRFSENPLAGGTTNSFVLTNVQLADAGGYTAVVTNAGGAATSQVATLTVLPPVFTKITNGSIVTNIGTGLSCAWGDYDNDGFIDLIITSGFDPVNRTGQKNILYHNNRDGTFTGITNTAVTAEGRDWRGCSWVDYDNDGDLDLFVTSTDANGFASENELFRNNGDGSFTKMTAAVVGAIVPGGGGSSEGPVWADYDRDGLVDAYVVRYGVDWLFHNNTDGTFSDVTNNIGIPLDGYDSYHGMWGDYDNDGWPDLVLPIGTFNNLQPVRNVLCHGLGDGTFTNLQTGSIVTNLGSSAGPGWGDYDNDGYLDLFVCSRSRNQLPNLLYHNNGDGTFTRMASNTVGSIVSDLVPIAFLNCSWGDYDNDGFLDLLVSVTGDGVSAVTNYLYRNDGNGSFTRVRSGKLVNDAGPAAFGCAWGDYDNDGFLDLFVARGAEVQRATNLLYRNNGNSNGWIKIKLVGTVSNRSAIGAKVRVLATIRGNSMWQMREINTGTGFRASPLDAHFGLGDATNLDTVRIEWPSGTVQDLHNVAAKQFLTITEPPRLAALGSPTNGPFQMQLTCWRGFDVAVETSSNLIDWRPWATVATTNRITRIDDPAGTIEAQRFYRVVFP